MRIIKDGRNNDIHFDWHELTGIYKMLSEKKENEGIKGHLLSQNYMARRPGKLNGKWRKGPGSWTSVDMDEMVDRIHNGYEFDTSIDPEHLPDIAYDRPRPRHTDDPEGEFDYDLYSMGETEHFLTRPKRRSLGGIRLKCQYNFSANINQKIIAEYTQWLGTVIQSLQARGYDLEVEIYSHSDEVYRGSRMDKHSIRVSKFGERVMPFDWSALFSPGGFRHFMFLAYMWPTEVDDDLIAIEGLGMPLGQKFDITWEPKQRVINVTTNSHSGHFPMEDMTKRFESWKG